MNMITNKVILIALALTIFIENTNMGKFTIHVLNTILNIPKM